MWEIHPALGQPHLFKGSLPSAPLLRASTFSSFLLCREDKQEVVSFPGPGAARALGTRESLLPYFPESRPSRGSPGRQITTCLGCGQLGLWGSAPLLGACGWWPISAHGSGRLLGEKQLTCPLSPSAPASGYNLDVCHVQSLSFPHAGRHFGYRVLQVGNE